MTYVEVWSEYCNEYYVNIVKELKNDVHIEEIVKTKDRSIASYVAKELARRKCTSIEYRIYK